MFPKFSTNKLLSVLLLLVALSALLAACGDSQLTATASSGSNSQNISSGQTPANSGQQGSGRSNPCSYLSKEDLATVAEFPFASPTTSSQGPTQSCNFSPSDTGKLYVVTLTVYQQDYDKNAFQQEITTAAQMMSGTAQPISGVGDVAYYMDNLLYVLKGNTEFAVSIASPAVTGQQEIDDLKALAQIITKKI